VQAEGKGWVDGRRLAQGQRQKENLPQLLAVLRKPL
jgi:hypothetical protein